MSAGPEQRMRSDDPKPRRNTLPRSKWLGRSLVLGDAVCIAVAVGLAGVIGRASMSGGMLAMVLERVVVLTSLGLYLLRHKQLHRAARSSVVTVELAGLFHVGVSIMAARLVLDELSFGEINWTRCIAAGTASTALLILWRSAYRARLRAFRLDGRFVRPVMIVGISSESKRLHRLLHDHPDAGFLSLGVVGDRQQAIDHGVGAAWAGPVENAIGAVEDGDSTGVILVSSALTALETNHIARRVQQAGGHVHVSSGIAGIDHRRFTTQPIAHEPLLYLEQPSMPDSGRAVKRVIDVVLAAFGLVVSAPLLLIAAIAIKIEDGGPVVFRQRRVGRDGEVFTIFKLRTMVIDAEEVHERLSSQNLRQGPLFKMDHDPRITRVGRVLRATDLDEIPQLVNVLKGQMSMVGPRPALPREVAQFDDELRRRTNVSPGLTGLWQVEARDNPSFEAYQRLDLFYVENWSVALDLVILMLTVESKIVQTFSKRRHGEMLSVTDELAAVVPPDQTTEPPVTTERAPAPSSPGTGPVDRRRAVDSSRAAGVDDDEARTAIQVD